VDPMLPELARLIVAERHAEANARRLGRAAASRRRVSRLTLLIRACRRGFAHRGPLGGRLASRAGSGHQQSPGPVPNES
jgi:hypothetical protein